MKRHLLSLIAILLCGVIHAATALQMGEVFTVKNNGSDVWTITPTASGTMKIVGDNGDGEWIGSCLLVYADAAMTSEVQRYNYTYYEVSVEAGHTYYIKNWNMTGGDYKAHCSMAEAFAFVKTVPAEGEPFYIEGDSEAFFYFTLKNVTFKSGELECNGHKVNIYNFEDQNELIRNGTFTYTEIGSSGIVNYNGNVVGHTNPDGFSVPFLTSTGLAYTNIIYDWLSTGKIEQGQKMTVKLHGVCSGSGELLNGDGELEVHWVAAGLPTTLEKATLPETFLSYWVPGDESGIAVFEFSREIKSAQAYIGMGYADASDRFESEVPVTVDGTKVKVDFTGEKRDASTMGLKTTYPQMEFKLFNVIDVDGKGTFSGDQGRASSYDYVMSYRDVSGEISYEITPATGSSLEGKDHIEIWYQDMKQIIETDGVEIVYYTTEVEKETVTEVVEGEEITREVEVMVNKEHTIFYSDQDLGAAWNVGIDGTTITVPVTDEMRAAKNISVRLHVVKNYDGRTHDIVAYYNTELLHLFEVANTADPVSESTVDLLSEVYFTLGSVYAINGDKATVTINGKDNMQYSGTGTIVADGKTNAKIVLDEPITEAGSYAISIKEGALGDYVYGESGYMAGNCNEAVTLVYAVSGKYQGKDVVASPEAGSTVEKLETISVTYYTYNTVAPTWNPEASPYVIAGDDVENPLSCQFVESVESSNVVTVKLDTPVNAEGDYTLVIPAGAVCNAATGADIANEYTFTYTVKAGTVVVGDKPVVTPAEGEYDEIEAITLNFGQAVTIVEPSEANDFWVPQPTLLSDDGGWTLYCTGTLSLGENEGEVVWTPEAKVVTGCNATLNIPEGCIKLADGSANKEYNYIYTITGNNEVKLAVETTTPEQMSEVEELSELVVTFDQAVEFDDWNTSVSANNDFWTKFGEGTLMATDDPCTVKVVFEVPLKEYGPATITFNANTFKTAKGYYAKPIFINITVGEDNGNQGGGDEPGQPSPDEKVIITPAEGTVVASLKYFEIKVEGYDDWWMDAEEQAYILDSEDTYMGFSSLSMFTEDGETAFWEVGKAGYQSLNFKEITKEGNYTLVLPVVCVYEGKEVNREFRFSYTILNGVGVASVKAADASEAYTLGGVKTTVSKPGLYIVGGKKVVIK